jgi:hypothetical protein
MHVKTRTTKLSFALLGTVALACADSAGVGNLRDIEPNLVSITAAPSTANGSGLIDLTSANAGFDEFFVKASRSRGGRASGTFRQVRGSGALIVDFTARIVCLTVDPATNRAWIGGVVTKNNSTNPAFLTGIHEIGDQVWFRVVDYKGTQPDRATTLGFEGSAGFITSEDYCRGKPWPGPPTDVVDARTFPLSAGDIVVTP